MIAGTVRGLSPKLLWLGLNLWLELALGLVVRDSVSVSVRVAAPQEQVAHHRIYGMARHRILRSTFGVLDGASVTEHNIGRIRVRIQGSHH